MSRVFVSGSSTGLGLMAGRLLVEQGHEVILHARDRARAEDAGKALPRAAAVVTGDLSRIAGMRSVAEQVNQLGRMDAVIHNAGVGYRGLCGKQTARRLAGVCRRPAVAPRPLQRGRARLGADAYGRPGRARRHRPSSPHAGPARGQRRSRGAGHGPVLLSSSLARAEPGSQGRRRTRSAHRGLPGALGHRALV